MYLPSALSLPLAEERAEILPNFSLDFFLSMFTFWDLFTTFDSARGLAWFLALKHGDTFPSRKSSPGFFSCFDSVR